jgi:hypothetical protein
LTRTGVPSFSSLYGMCVRYATEKIIQLIEIKAEYLSHADVK